MKKALLVVVLSIWQAIAIPAVWPAGEKSSSPAPEASSTGTGRNGARAEHPVVTHHVARINGETVPYTATTGMLRLNDDEGKPVADIFFVAYARDDIQDLSQRPLTFAFNGGPGASAIWLHLGALGPKRVPLTGEGTSLPPPYRVVDNQSSWLAFTDLVFIDPVGTGYSRASPGQEPKRFYGVREDIRTIGDFVRLYVTKYQRWLSPKFLAGESYGTIRAAGLSEYLLDTYGMSINGLVLISQALNFQTFAFRLGNDLPYVLWLPSYTAVAFYHQKLSPELQRDLQTTLAEVEQWAMQRYIVGLAKGDSLTAGERKSIVDHLTRYTGLQELDVVNSNFRIDVSLFRNALLRSENRIVGLLDGRFTGVDAEGAFDDPSLVRTMGPYVAVWNDYVQTELRYENEAPYRFFSMQANRQWNWGSASHGYVNITGSLRQAMVKNTHLRVFIASGYYDLDTPYFATKYTANHLHLERHVRDNIMLSYYAAGHQMYTDSDSLKAFAADVARFMTFTPSGHAP